MKRSHSGRATRPWGLCFGGDGGLKTGRGAAPRARSHATGQHRDVDHVHDELPGAVRLHDLGLVQAADGALHGRVDRDRRLAAGGERLGALPARRVRHLGRHDHVADDGIPQGLLLGTAERGGGDALGLGISLLAQRLPRGVGGDEEGGGALHGVQGAGGGGGLGPLAALLLDGEELGGGGEGRLLGLEEGLQGAVGVGGGGGEGGGESRRGAMDWWLVVVRGARPDYAIVKSSKPPSNQQNQPTNLRSSNPETHVLQSVHHVGVGAQHKRMVKREVKGLHVGLLSLVDQVDLKHGHGAAAALVLLLERDHGQLVIGGEQRAQGRAAKRDRPLVDDPGRNQELEVALDGGLGGGLGGCQVRDQVVGGGKPQVRREPLDARVAGAEDRRAVVADGQGVEHAPAVGDAGDGQGGVVDVVVVVLVVVLAVSVCW